MLSITLLTSLAFARPVVHVEGATTVAELESDSRILGTGAGVRMGYGLNLAVLRVTPEAGVSIWNCDTTTYLARAGARAQLGKGFMPGAYAHLGYLLGSEPVAGWDAGLSVDVTLSERVELGGLAGLQSFGANPVVTAGAQLGFKLGERREDRRRR